MIYLKIIYFTIYLISLKILMAVLKIPTWELPQYIYLKDLSLKSNLASWKSNLNTSSGTSYFFNSSS